MKFFLAISIDITFIVMCIDNSLHVTIISIYLILIGTTVAAILSNVRAKEEEKAKPSS